ncbi:MAG: hypothetical protein GX847_08385, partial [Clostridiales bacterium]|nr:hypothetical protein [Clostridiales bacterium]
MKKGTIIFIMTVLLIFLVMPGAGAAEAENNPAARMTAEEVQESQANALETDKLENAVPEDAGSLLGDMKITDSLDLSGGVSTLLKGVQSG